MAIVGPRAAKVLKHIVFLAGTNRTWKSLDFEACRIKSDRRNPDGDVVPLAACLELEQNYARKEKTLPEAVKVYIYSRRTYARLRGEHVIRICQ